MMGHQRQLISGVYSQKDTRVGLPQVNPTLETAGKKPTRRVHSIKSTQRLGTCSTQNPRSTLPVQVDKSAGVHGSQGLRVRLKAHRNSAPLQPGNLRNSIRRGLHTALDQHHRPAHARFDHLQVSRLPTNRMIGSTNIKRAMSGRNDEQHATPH